ncbi:protein ROS1A [Hevea brasiliensis]|uniref:protein ROS1A n=1 Tax=Hevea brasiliensis TaxID=3981 RepID=UPI0025ED4B12|nr:protein ROS1A [Hevea brasiliensis]
MEKQYVRKTESKKRRKPSTQQTSVIVGMQSDVGSFGGHKLLNDLDLYTNSFRWRSHGKRSVRSKIGFHRGSSWVQQLNFPKRCKRMRTKRQKKSVVSIMLGFLRLCGWMKKKRSKRFIERGNFSWLALIQMINNQILNIPLNQICSEFKKLPDPPQELGIGEGEGKVKHERNVPESSIEIPVRQALTNEEHEIPILTQNHEKKLTQNCIEIRPSPVNLKFQDVSSLKNKELQVAAKSKVLAGPLKIFNKKGSVNQKAGDVIEELIHKFKKLKIIDISAIVPYQSSDSTKKTKPKVILDSETARRWNLLMGIDNGACKENVDEEKQKKWEEERKIFHGRVDSFTSKMHVVLGDRRFKPWKGSVVDSVVGVFLTQNVSDFLSSSAYMSLAAKFPVKPSNEEASVDDLENKNSQGSTKARQDSDGNQYFIIEPEPKTPADMVEETSLVDIEDLGNTALPQEYHRHKNKVWRCKNSENASRGMEHMNSISKSKRLNCLNASSTSTTPSDLDDSFEMSCSSSSACHKSYNSELMEGCRAENVVKEKMSEAEVEMKGNPHTQSELNETVFKTLNLVMKIRCALRSVDKTRKTTGGKKEKVQEKKVEKSDWDDLRRMYSKPRTREQTDTVDWEAVRQAPLTEIAEIIKGRGQHTIIAKRIQDFLNRVVDYHGSVDLEWLRYAPPDLVKAYLLEIPGLGLKSVECVQLLTLGNNAFPVDVNVDRISVRLGWVPLEPLPGDLQFHLLEEYPIMDSIQKYLWPRLSELDHRTLYELHYHMITFGKVFCTKKNPNCGACPMRAECRHHASAVASANIALPGPAKKGEERSIVPKIPVGNSALAGNGDVVVNPISESLLESDKKLESELRTQNCEPFIEEPESPKIEQDIEELATSKYIIDDEEEEIPTIKLNNDSFKENVQHFMDKYGPNLQTDNLSRALVPIPVNVNSIPMRKLKQTNRLRTEHQVYEIPDNHELLRGLEKRECDDSLPFLLAIWRAGETPDSCEPPKKRCSSQGPEICNDLTCFYCQSILEDKDEIVRGTILIPCRTAMRGRFPLNGTYFQVNEVFADHETSYNPIIVPRSSIWYLKRRTVYIGTSPSAIFRGISSITEIQENFWRGFICVRGWDSKTRQPKPLCKRFHCPPSKMDKARKRPQII